MVRTRAKKSSASRAMTHAAEDVAVAAEILGRRVHHEIGAELNRPLQDGCRPRVVDGEPRARPARDRGSGRDVGHVQPRVRRRLSPDEPGTRSHGRLDGRRIGHVHERRLQAPPREVIAQQDRRAVVGILGRDHVIAGIERLEDGRRRGRSGRERRGARAAFQLAETRLEREPRGVGRPRVNETAGILAVRGALEGSGQMNRRRHRARARIDGAAGMNGQRFDVHGTGYTQSTA